jgi:membrane-associated phospholipid phosphatase
MPIYPVLCGILYFKRSERHMEDYPFTLAITNFVCDAGFILFPVAGPLFKIADQYTIPLKGYFFTFLGELIRNHVHDIGGCLPSPHCAVATVMGVMAYRYRRPTFIILSPVILSLYVSAFYGRFHYLTDVVIGILAAWFVLRIVPSLMRGWNAWLDRRLRRNV